MPWRFWSCCGAAEAGVGVRRVAAETSARRESFIVCGVAWVSLFFFAYLWCFI